MSAGAKRCWPHPVRRGSCFESRRLGILDSPLEPVKGLAEGETHWRGMTVESGATSARFARSPPYFATIARHARFVPPDQTFPTIHRAARLKSPATVHGVVFAFFVLRPWGPQLEATDFRRTAGPSASRRALRRLPAAHWRASEAGDSRHCSPVPVRVLSSPSAAIPAMPPARGSTDPSSLASSARRPPARPRAPCA